MRDLPKGRCTGSGFFVYISKYAATNALLPEDEHCLSSQEDARPCTTTLHKREKCHWKRVLLLAGFIYS